MTEAHTTHYEHLEDDQVILALPHIEPSEERGRWEVHNPENPNLTPASRIKIGRVAAAFTERYPNGWHFVAEEADRHDKYGHVEYFVPDSEETTQ